MITLRPSRGRSRDGGVGRRHSIRRVQHQQATSAASRCRRANHTLIFSASGGSCLARMPPYHKTELAALEFDYFIHSVAGGAGMGETMAREVPFSAFTAWTCPVGRPMMATEVRAARIRRGCDSRLRVQRFSSPASTVRASLSTATRLWCGKVLSLTAPPRRSRKRLGDGLKQISDAQPCSLLMGKTLRGRAGGSSPRPRQASPSTLFTQGIPACRRESAA